MPSYGPWVQPDTVSGFVTGTSLILGRQGSNFGDTVTIVYEEPKTEPPVRTAATIAAEEQAVRSLLDGHGDDRTVSGATTVITQFNDGGVAGVTFEPVATTVVCALDFRTLQTQLLHPDPSTWPAGAVGVQSESATGAVTVSRFQFRWRIVFTDNNVQTPVVSSGLVAFRAESVLNTFGTLTHPWLTPAKINIAPKLAEMPTTSTSQGELSPIVEVQPGPPAGGWVVVGFAPTRMRDGYIYDGEGVNGIIAGAHQATDALAAAYSYVAPRYRFVFETAPPLRQVQRNDGLALGAPRQVSRSSLQRSLRQGPRTYR